MRVRRADRRRDREVRRGLAVVEERRRRLTRGLVLEGARVTRPDRLTKSPNSLAFGRKLSSRSARGGGDGVAQCGAGEVRLNRIFKPRPLRGRHDPVVAVPLLGRVVARVRAAAFRERPRLRLRRRARGDARRPTRGRGRRRARFISASVPSSFSGAEYTIFGSSMKIDSCDRDAVADSAAASGSAAAAAIVMRRRASFAGQLGRGVGGQLSERAEAVADVDEALTHGG